MGEKLDKLVKDIVTALKESDRKTSGYDTIAEVKRVDGKTAYVHIPGGIDETPVRMAVSAKKGDQVRVRVSGGKAWLTGNVTEPPTGDGEVNKIRKLATDIYHKVGTLQKKQDEISAVASEAMDMADSAMTSANGKNTIYRASSQPTGGTYANGDVWFDTAHDNKIYRYDGTTWVGFALGDDALDSLSANKLTAGTIDASQITVSNLDAGNITTGKLGAARIKVDEIEIGTSQVSGLDTTLGDTVRDVRVEYAKSTSDSTEPTSGWSTTYPTSITSSQFVWERVGYKEGNSSSYTYNAAVCVSANQFMKFDSTNGVRVYSGNKDNTTYNTSYTQIKSKSIDLVADSTTLAHMGKATGQDSGGSTSSSEYPYYTFGTRAQDTATTRGNYSFAQGYSVKAQGYASHAEGTLTTASGPWSHAEGRYTTASGRGAHADGNETEAKGDYSNAQNLGTIANHDYQTVIGKYNNNKSTNLFEIGKGTGTSARANAFAVTTDGALEIGDPANTFAVTTETMFSSTSMSAGGAQNSHKTVSNPSYYPIGIVGWQTGSGDINAADIYLDDQTSGSATVYYIFKNVGSQSRTVTAKVDILWVKIA